MNVAEEKFQFVPNIAHQVGTARLAPLAGLPHGTGGGGEKAVPRRHNAFTPPQHRLWLEL